jgi:fructosamine-3-kinase
VIDNIKSICKIHDISVQNAERLTGGDINEVYKIYTQDTNYVLKLNSLFPHRDMFDIEAKSLRLLAESESFVIPRVIANGEYGKFKYLLLEYIQPGNYGDISEDFALSLAKLHKQSASKFGLDFDNYIGSLPQINTPIYDNAGGFYIHLRLEPQFKLAAKKGYHFQNIDKLYQIVEQIVPNERPALIHGDLWSGNYLATSASKACILDPAIAYAPREMDMAMMKLFGGFSEHIFQSYNELFPLEGNWQERLKVWQLYYILVHVNLFGGHYYTSAQQLIDAYTK